MWECCQCWLLELQELKVEEELKVQEEEAVQHLAVPAVWRR